MTKFSGVIVHSNDKVTVPPGEYYLGDPCYSIGEDRDKWIDLCDKWYIAENKGSNPVAQSGDSFVLAFNTAYGDGSYPGSDGKYYCVDAGIIGLVPVEIADKGTDLVTKITFTEPTVCTSENGVLTFGSVVIDTDPSYDDEEDEEEDN